MSPSNRFLQAQLPDLFAADSSAMQQLPLAGADVRYWPDFLPDHAQWFEQLRDTLAWQQDEILMYGRPCKIPRLNAWYADAGMHYAYSGLQLALHPWTDALQALKAKVEQQVGASFNSVLANLYRDGRDSVAWHSDDEPELGARPIIASLSLGATRRFSFRPKLSGGKTGRDSIHHIDLLGGSLLLMQGGTQQLWLHQLPKQTGCEARINLTFRRIVRG